MKLAIIGCGNIIRKEHIPAIRSLGVEIHGLCDLSLENANKAGGLLDNKPLIFTCYREMIDKINPNVIVVALPHFLYRDVIDYCSHRKISVIKEKPFALSIIQASEIKSITEKNDVEIFTVCQKRYTSSYLKLKEYISSGEDDFACAKIRYTIPSKTPNSDWRSKYVSAGGGVWLDMGYHIVNLVDFLFDGKKIKINYSRLINTSSGDYDVDDTAFAELQCGNTIIFLYISCVDYEKNEDVTLIGKKYIVYANKNMVKVKSKNQEIIKEFIFKDEIESPFIRMYRDFLFSKSERCFEKNLASSLLATNILENAFIESGFKVVL